MTEREINRVLQAALDKGLILSYARQGDGWLLREARAGHKVLTQSELVKLARRLKQRL